MDNYVARLVKAVTWNVRNTGRTWRARRFDVHPNKSFNIKLNALWMKAAQEKQGFIMIFDDQAAIDRLLTEDDPSLADLRRYVSIMRDFGSGVVVTVDELHADISSSTRGLTLDPAEPDKALQLFLGTFVSGDGKMAKPVILRGDTIRYLAFFCPQCMVGGQWPAFIVHSWMFELQQFQRALYGRSFVDPELVYRIGNSQLTVSFPELVPGTLVAHAKAGESEIVTVDRSRVVFTDGHVDPTLSRFVAEPGLSKMRCPCRYPDEPKVVLQRVMPMDVMASQ